MRQQGEGGVCKPRREASGGANPQGAGRHLELRLPASKTSRKYISVAEAMQSVFFGRSHPVSPQRASQAVLVVQNLLANAGDTEMRVRSLDWEDPVEKEMATYSSILAWRIPWTEEPSGLKSTESKTVGHN